MDIKNFVIPAVDIRQGSVVRLLRGEFDKAKVYPFKPKDLARIFKDAGFSRIHVVDLDGAEEGRLRNFRHIKEVRSTFDGLMEVGGGIRSFEVAKSLLEEGIDFVVLGTLAVKNPKEFERIIETYPDRVILSIDSKGGKVAVGGWVESSSISPQELAERYEDKPVWGYLYTIIERDGSLEGVGVEDYKKIKSVVRKPVLASGGVSSLADVEKLYGLVEGVVVGRAIYEGRIPVEGFSLMGT